MKKTESRNTETSFLIQGPWCWKIGIVRRIQGNGNESSLGCCVKIKPDGLWDAEQLKKDLKRE
ncbi:MAG: hypothetical protein OXC67_07010 [Flavobacteriaceae bacterium]|nr:hypothetical protein [Flavobacteriaceae bacterium]